MYWPRIFSVWKKNYFPSSMWEDHSWWVSEKIRCGKKKCLLSTYNFPIEKYNHSSHDSPQPPSFPLAHILSLYGTTKRSIEQNVLRVFISVPIHLSFFFFFVYSGGENSFSLVPLERFSFHTHYRDLLVIVGGYSKLQIFSRFWDILILKIFHPRIVFHFIKESTVGVFFTQLLTIFFWLGIIQRNFSSCFHLLKAFIKSFKLY